MSQNVPGGAPSAPPADNYSSTGDPIQSSGGWIWAPLRGKWLVAKPEELVRQRFIYRLHREYGYSLKQMAQERRTMHGHGSPKADIVVAADEQALQGNRDYVLVVETKAEHVTIVAADYQQGESYARAVGCEFLVAHNEKETRAFRLVPGAPGSRIDIEDAPKLEDFQDAKRLESIRAATKAFSRDEFRRLLQECHAILRDNHKLDPGAAFDEISKVLFIKMFFERGVDGDRFTRKYVDDYAKVRRSRSDEVMDDLFEDTKKGLQGERLFDTGDKLLISIATFRRLVEKLERFNLSATSEDVKGIAFEQFLGQTFRGELGQFFTPRPIVDFMVEILDPKEGELICDPASGTGGFLIRAFEYVRDAIEVSVQAEKSAAIAAIEKEAVDDGWDETALADAIEGVQRDFNAQLDIASVDSRLGRLSRECIYGTDAEVRAARTSKMNMIMHGDGHGGIYFHDGLLDTGGFLKGRFDVVLTNPPFGAAVASDQVVGDTSQTRMTDSNDEAAENAARYGDSWKRSNSELQVAERERWPILQMFDIGRDPIAGPVGTAKIRNSRPTETLFLERIIDLLTPGGRCGVVLPDGLLNNPSMQWLRDYIEERARILAVVSLPQEVFASAKATVKTSIVFLQRFTLEEVAQWADALEHARTSAAVLAAEDLIRDAETAANTAATALGLDADRAIAAHRKVQSLYGGDAESMKMARAVLNKEVPKAKRADFRALLSDYNAQVKLLRAQVGEVRIRAAKELFDYPIFMAEAEHAGITSTGVTGPAVVSDLPLIRDAYRAWLSDSSSLVEPVISK